MFKLRGLKDKFGLASKEESKQLSRQMEQHIQGLELGRRMTHLRICKEASVTKYRDWRGDGCIDRDPSSAETGSRKHPFQAQVHVLDFGFDL